MLAQAGGPIVNLTTTLVNQPVKGMPSARRPPLADWIAASLRTCCTTPFSGLFAIVAVLDYNAGRLFHNTRPTFFGAPIRYASWQKMVWRGPPGIGKDPSTRVAV
jgi:hypothetical protein